MSRLAIVAVFSLMHGAGAVGATSGCRAELRPLLLDPAPPAAELERVRVLCVAQADAGDPDATYQLAFFHLGLGGAFAPTQALPLIRAAAEAGVSEAQYWLAWQSEEGPLLPHDPRVARDWYERAAASRHRLALERLAKAHANGELGYRVDRRRALELRAEIRRCPEM